MAICRLYYRAYNPTEQVESVKTAIAQSRGRELVEKAPKALLCKKSRQSDPISGNTKL